jgi:transcriptional regulator with XRE-family HTH domain
MTATIITPPTKTQVKDFLSFLKKLQKSRKFTNAQLADFVHVNRSTLTRWMTKKAIPSTGMMDLKYSVSESYAEMLYIEADDIHSAIPDSFINRFVDPF